MDFTISDKSIYNQIVLQDHIATTIAQYGQSCGMENFMDNLDLNCGAIPQGTFEQIIDPTSPKHFLNLYTDIAHKRLAYTIINMFRVSRDFQKPVLNFLIETGANLGISQIHSLEQALEIFHSIILLKCSNTWSPEIVSSTDTSITFKFDFPELEQIWKNWNGNFTDYMACVSYFSAGLFQKTDFRFSFSQGNFFTISRN